MVYSGFLDAEKSALPSTSRVGLPQKPMGCILHHGPDVFHPADCRIYGARWKIESGYQEIKREIGIAKSLTRNAYAVTNHLNFCMVAATVTLAPYRLSTELFSLILPNYSQLSRQNAIFGIVQAKLEASEVFGPGMIMIADQLTLTFYGKECG